MNKENMIQAKKSLSYYRRIISLVLNEPVIYMELGGDILDKNGDIEEGDVITLTYVLNGEEGVDITATELIGSVVDIHEHQQPILLPNTHIVIYRTPTY